MLEINSFARPMLRPQKDQRKTQQSMPVYSGSDVFHKPSISDSVHFTGTKRKQQGANPPAAPKGPAAPDSGEDSDDEMSPRPPNRPRGRQPVDDFFGLLGGSDPSVKNKQINPAKEMAKHIQPFQAEDSDWEAYQEVGEPYADMLAEINARSYLNNAVLRADDPQVQQSILMSLKEKLGLTPLFSVDCAPKNLEALEEHYQGPVLSNVFAESAKKLGLPVNQPTVLFLKNADADETEQLQKKDAFQRIKNKNPHFRFVIGQPSQAAAATSGNALQIMLGGSRERSTDTRPAPFETVMVSPLNNEQWSKTLLHDQQTRQILDHWKLNIPQETLQVFLNTLQRGKTAPLERDYILGELDSLASFIRMHQKDQSGKIIPDHVTEFAKTLNLPSQALIKVPALSAEPLEQKPYKIIKAGDIKTRLDDVVGHKGAKAVLSHALEAIKYPALYAHLNEGDEDAQNNHVLLMGEPGGGKTMLARAVAGEGQGTFISSSGSQFVNVYVGMGANNMRQLKSAIENVSSDLAVVFIDEIDSLGNRDKSVGGGSSSREEAQTINEFLALTEGIGQNKKKVLLIGATNRPEALDLAILSRFHHKIDIDKLNGAQRTLLLTKQMQQKQLTPDASVDMGDLAKLTEGFSGRDLRNVLKLAKQELIRNIPVEQKEKLEKNLKARKQFQLHLSQDALLNAINEIKKGWKGANKELIETPPPFGLYT